MDVPLFIYSTIVYSLQHWFVSNLGQLHNLLPKTFLYMCHSTHSSQLQGTYLGEEVLVFVYFHFIDTTAFFKGDDPIYISTSRVQSFLLITYWLLIAMQQQYWIRVLVCILQSTIKSGYYHMFIGHFQNNGKALQSLFAFSFQRVKEHRKGLRGLPQLSCGLQCSGKGHAKRPRKVRNPLRGLLIFFLKIFYLFL